MTRTIKRYKNRKLYDTETASYVSFDEVREIIEKGDDISVIDHANGKDITVYVLSMVISNTEAPPSSSLDVDIRNRLVEIIRLFKH